MFSVLKRRRSPRCRVLSVCDTLANNMLLIIFFSFFLQVNAASPAAGAATCGGGENKKQGPGPPSQLNNELEFPSCNGGDTRLVKGKSMPSLR